jgi:hypothetical protein
LVKKASGVTSESTHQKVQWQDFIASLDFLSLNALSLNALFLNVLFLNVLEKIVGLQQKSLRNTTKSSVLQGFELNKMFILLGLAACRLDIEDDQKQRRNQDKQNGGDKAEIVNLHENSPLYLRLRI